MKLTIKKLLAATLTSALSVALSDCGCSNNAASAADAPSERTWDATPIEAGKRNVLTVNGVEYAFRYCPGGTFSGTFQMGHWEEHERAFLLQHEVKLTRGFWMLETEVTQEMYEALTDENPSFFSESGGGAWRDTSRFPVENVSWEDCQAFVEKLNAGGFAPEGFEFRLPTEAEWEFACRAGTKYDFSWDGGFLNGEEANCDGKNRPYPWAKEVCIDTEYRFGEVLERYEVIPGKYLERTTEVGSYAPNLWGLYDMHGNVWEWCADWYGAYAADPQTNPTGPATGKEKTLRGGGWDSGAADCRSFSRRADLPTNRSNSYGFRVVLSRKVDPTSQSEVSEEANENSGVAWDTASTAGTRKTLTLDGVEYAFRYCPAGTFTMGSPESEEGRNSNETQREVTLTRGFWTLETEVTKEMYKSVTGLNPIYFSTRDGGIDVERWRRSPMENVCWDDCQAFIKQLNDAGVAPKGFEFRLPTEAEWEYACRAGTTTPYSWGASLNGDQANCDGSQPYGTVEEGADLRHTTEDGSSAPNPWGLYDMHGSVAEWCADWHNVYDTTSLTDPTGPSVGIRRVARGGSWKQDCRSAYRRKADPTVKSDILGFRLVLARKVDAAPPKKSAVVWDAASEAGTRQILAVDGVEYAFRYCPERTVKNPTPAWRVAEDGFWILETEVTQEMYKSVTGENPSSFSKSGESADAVKGLDTSRFPVERVQAYDLEKFIRKLNDVGVAPKGFEFSLPTEAEWEYACRAGTTTPYSWGESLNGDQANCDGKKPYGTNERGAFLSRTMEVGSYAPNPWGLYDMHGNVAEWCWNDDYTDSDRYVVRGGSWYMGAVKCRADTRNAVNDGKQVNSDLGFRIVLERIL